MAFRFRTRLLARAVGGDPAAFEELLAVHREAILAVLRRQVRLPEGDAGEIFRWFLIHLEADSITDSLFLEWEPAPLPRLRPHDLLTLTLALAELPPRDRELIYRKHYLGQSPQEISESVGARPKAAGVALFLAQRRLRRDLERAAAAME